MGKINWLIIPFVNYFVEFIGELYENDTILQIS